jgi:predicted O-methyltransferase YrrM
MDLPKLEHFYESVEGWFTDQDAAMYKFAIDRSPNPAHFVEIGCHKGRSSSYAATEIANSGKSITFDCIDIWEDNLVFEEFKVNMKPLEKYHTAINLASMEAVKLYQNSSLDFVFIDGDHHLAAVTYDIKKWYPKVKPQGILAGHDLHFETVKTAVEKIFENYQTIGNCWYVIKK